MRARASLGATPRTLEGARRTLRLFGRLPRAFLPAGGKVTATITYGGTPHVAVKAPWDDGMVWSKTPDGRTWFAALRYGIR